MKLNVTRTLFFVLLSLGLAFSLHSCRKQDKPAPATESRADLEQRSIEALKDRIANAPARSSSVLFDKRWKIDLARPSTSRLQSTCWDGSTDLYGVSLEILREYYCTVGDRFHASWKISVPNNINIVSTNGSFTTTGRIRLRNAVNAIISTYTLTGSSVTISSTTVPDPLYSTNKIYTLTFSTPYISAANMNGVVRVESTMTVATDCDDIDGFTVGPFPSGGMTVGDLNTSPCIRNDIMYVNPTSYSGGCSGTLDYLPSIAASSVVGTCNVPGYTLPDNQRIQWREVNSSNVPLEAWGSNANHERLLPYWGVYTLIRNTNFESCKRYEFRYRNESSCGVTPFWTSGGYFNL